MNESERDLSFDAGDDRPRSSSTSNDATSSQSVFWPLAILSSAILLLMLMQLWNLWSQRADLQLNFQNRRTALAQTQELQQRVNGVVQELLLLSQSNADAKAIVQKYRIQMNTPPPPPNPEQQ